MAFIKTQKAESFTPVAKTEKVASTKTLSCERCVKGACVCK